MHGLRLACTYLHDGEKEEASWTYAQLATRAKAIASGLQSRRARGARVLLVYPPGLEYIAAFWGCLLSGAIAVPVYPPRSSRNLNRLKAVIADAQATLALTTSHLLPSIQNFREDVALSDVAWIATEDYTDDLASEWRQSEVTSDSVAFLQYTSGSTGTPKGVIVTHENLLRNEAAIQEAFAQSESSVVVGWLPLYHDMGLIGNVLQPLYVGAHCVLMSPVAFLQRPLRWLQAISRYRATTSGGPNFAYDLCTKKIAAGEETGLDLSSWQVAFNGAEHVRLETLRAFAARFESVGFSKSAFAPCYGLAEATLLVSMHKTGQAPVSLRLNADALAINRVREEHGESQHVRSLVSCGELARGTCAAVVDAESQLPCPPDAIGEIWLSGPSIAQGYWGRDDESRRTFRARMSDAEGGGYLRTGDLGFLREGQLFLTGRLKDVILIRGRNHYPSDIEATIAAAHPALRQGSGAAFSIEVDGEEKCVIVQELERGCKPNPNAIFDALRDAVLSEHEIQLHAIALIRHGSIAKTSSGKIQRHACRSEYLAGRLKLVAQWSVTDSAAEPGVTSAIEERTSQDVTTWIRHKLAARAGISVDAVGLHDQVARFSIDSLASVELVHAMSMELGIVAEPHLFLQAASIVEIAAEVERRGSAVQTQEEYPQTWTREFPLTVEQKSLWFLHQLDPESTAYNIGLAARVLGPVDTRALRLAFESLIKRHEMFRTTFIRTADSVLQRVSDTPAPFFAEEDASGWSDEAVHARLEREAGHRFRLESGALLRVLILRRNHDEYFLSLVVHHIITDMWSLDLAMREVGRLYLATVRGQATPLAPLKCGFSDYAHWQQRMLSSPEGDALSAFWGKELSSEPPVLNLPVDRPRPLLQTFQGAAVSFELSASVSAALRRLSEKHGTTLYAVLLAGLNVLLFRYTGQSEIWISSPVACRSREEWAGVVGYFANPLIMRTALSADLAFDRFVSQVRATVLSALEHQHYPFAKLVEQLRPARESSWTPLTQVMFSFEKTGGRDEGVAAFTLGKRGATVQLGGLDFEPIQLPARTAQYELTVSMGEVNGALCGKFQYNTDLYESETIERMVGHWEELLRSIVAGAEQQVGELGLLRAAERRQIVEEWNATGREYSREQTLADLFEEQVRRTPQREALVYERERLTYQELNRRANEIAHELQRRGAGAETLIGVCLERSVELVVALLGVLKAGAAYVPLDPGYPAERLGYMVADAGARLILTSAAIVERIPELRSAGAEALCLERGGWGSVAAENPRRQTSGENLAYLIYTSGSTGKPKAVMIVQRSAVLLCEWARNVFGAEQLTGTLASTSICFDLSAFELWAPLLCGGSVLLVRNVLAMETAGEAIQLLNTVPSALAELLRSGRWQPGIRVVNLAGEALPRELVERLYERGVERVYNLYGPSEDTTYSTYGQMKPGREPGIGRPLWNTQVYIVDAQLRPLPVGVAGEIYLGGEGLSRGYFQRPALTAERFVPNPYSRTGGERLYRTGDLGRYRADGEIEYLGRLDQQVKIRGFRIELGEVEAVLRACPAVAEAAVTVREYGAEDKRLVGYVVWRSGAAPSTGNQLREQLRRQLPEYLVPWVIVELQQLPLTRNGKLDRRALPEPEPAHLAEYVEPQAGTEQTLAGIWADVLKLERVGAHDNFFDLGGHSLLATQLVSRMEQAFGIDIPLRVIFQDPVLRGLSNAVEALSGGAAQGKEEGIARRLSSVPAPLSYGQQRLWFLDQFEPDWHSYNLPGAFLLEGDLNVSALESALNEIVRRHEVLRTSFVIGDHGEPEQRVHPVLKLNLQPRTVPESAIAALAEEEAGKPFHLTQGPLVRVNLLQVTERRHVLLVTVHHIVADGWSLEIFRHELGVAYSALRQGNVPELPELAIQFGDFAVWQREWLKGETLANQLLYWRTHLAGFAGTLELPADRTRPAVQTYSGAHRRLRCQAEIAAGVRQLAREESATTFMVLLASLQLLLSRYSGQADIAIGTPVANRTRPETEKLIGFFVNTLVMRTQVQAEETFRELLRRVRETALGAYANQDLPFEKLVEELKPERDLSRSPLFQVMLAFENMPPAERELPGLRWTALEVESHTAKFDLTFFLSDAEEGGFSGSVEYNTDLYEAETIARMVGHWEELLRSIVAGAEQQVGELGLLRAAERRQLVEEWNATGREYSREQTLADLFEEQVRRTPQREALVYERERLTYQELNRRANEIAHELLRRGAGAETLIGVCLERSVELVVALLGVLKAGAAYVPLDPGYPAERLGYMVADAGARLILTSAAIVERIPELRSSGAETICLSPGGWGSVAAENPRRQTSGENLAYLIYTSGSTGKPKAVMIVQRSAVLLCEWARTVFGAEQLTGTLASTSICFDLSAFELWAPLLCGGSVLLVRNVLEMEAAGEAIQLVNTVPSALAELLRSGRWQPGIRVVNLAGEALPRELVERLYERGVQRVYNLYGPSEDTTYSTYGQMKPGREPAIGRPLWNTQVYIVDAQLRPLPVGVAGEIYLGGEGLSRGYFQRPALTAERFVPNPYSRTGGERLYRTGDLGRYRADGEIEYLGRLDQQVKIRGFRIELGEVEAVLRACPAVAEAAVTVREYGAEDKRLVGYVVWRNEAAPGTGIQLREQLRRQLPEYLVPWVIVELQQLPLTRNGKLDRRALPEPESAPLAEYVEPQPGAEQTLAGIWAEVLKLERVGAHDNFFDLGGHSLLATQLVSRINAQLPTDIRVRTLFESPTISQLAKHISLRPIMANNTPELTPLSREAYRVRVTVGQIPELPETLRVSVS